MDFGEKMIFSRVLKLAIGALFLLTTDSLLAYAAVSRLPKGCEDHSLVHGDPKKARTFLLGEKHDVCDQARKKCTEGLVKARKGKKSSTAFLFEEAGYDKRIDCASKGVGHLSNNCRGWNRLHKNYIDKTRPLLKFNGLKAMMGEFDLEINRILRTKPPSQQKEAILDYVDDYINIFQEMVAVDQENGMTSKADPELFNPAHQSLELHKYQIAQATAFRNKVAKSQVLSPHLLKDLTAEWQKQADSVNKWGKDKQDFIRVPNDALIGAIRNQTKNKNNKLIFAYAGDLHVNDDSRANGQKEAERQIVRELYKELNGFADENPYAVLSCTLS